MFAFLVTANFTSLFSMYLSIKMNNAYLACVLMFIGCFMTLFSLNPKVGIIFALTPLGNYIVIADGLKEMFRIGIFPVTPHLLSLLFTSIIIVGLLIKIRVIYTIKA